MKTIQVLWTAILIGLLAAQTTQQDEKGKHECLWSYLLGRIISGLDSSLWIENVSHSNTGDGFWVLSGDGVSMSGEDEEEELSVLFE